MLNREKISENRPLAWSVFAVVIVLSILLSGGGALKSDRSGATSVFYIETNEFGISTYEDLSDMVSCAYNVASTAGAYSSIDATAVESVMAAVAAFEDAGKNNISGMYEAYNTLKKAVEDLYTKIDNCTELTEPDQKYMYGQYKEFKSCIDKISREENYTYDDLAVAFNNKLDSFPASALAKLFGVDELPLFE